MRTETDPHQSTVHNLRNARRWTKTRNKANRRSPDFFKFKLYLSCKCGQLINWPQITYSHATIKFTRYSSKYTIVLSFASSIPFTLIIRLDQPSHFACICVQGSYIFVYLHGYSTGIFTSTFCMHFSSLITCYMTYSSYPSQLITWV